MSAIIDDKVVASAKAYDEMKEDPIVVLTVCKFWINKIYYISNQEWYLWISIINSCLYYILFSLFQKYVDALYHFRDHYFENHSIEDAKNKNDDLEIELKDTLAKFDECKVYEIDGSRAKYYYLKGKALNVVERFIPQTEELLSKAVKLEPKLLDAWNELGECYWKKNDIKQAKNCFLGALPHVSLLY